MRTRKRARSEAAAATKDDGMENENRETQASKEEVFAPEFDITESEGGVAQVLRIPENVDAKDLVGTPLCHDIFIRARLSRLPTLYEEEEEREETGKNNGSMSLAKRVVEHVARSSAALSRCNGLRASYFFQRSSSFLDEIVLLLGCSDRKFNPFWMTNRVEEALHDALDHKRPLLNIFVKPVTRRADTVRSLVNYVNASSFSRRRERLEDIHAKMLLPSKSSGGLASYVEWVGNRAAKLTCVAQDPDPMREIELPVVIDPVEYAYCEEDENDEENDGDGDDDEEEEEGDETTEKEEQGEIRSSGRRETTKRRKAKCSPIFMYCCSSAEAGGNSSSENIGCDDDDKDTSDREKKQIKCRDPIDEVIGYLQRANPAAASKIKHARKECSMTGSKKRREWLDFVARLPFTKGSLPTLDRTEDGDGNKSCARFLQTTKQKLDNTVFGMHGAKNAAMEMVARTLSYAVPADHQHRQRSSPPLRSLLFEGPPGSGKTTFAACALGSVLQRPVRLINVGGAKDASSLVGIPYSYEGSRPGRIAEEIVSTGVMDPIIIFDEVDKISDTSIGHEITNVLMSLVDPTQNHGYNDVYLAGVPLDLSRVLFVMTCNDASLINPVLLDRVRVVSVPALSKKEHVSVTRDYVFPRVAARCGGGNIVLQDGATEALLSAASSLSSSCRRENDSSSSSSSGIRDIEKLVERVIMRSELRSMMCREDLDIMHQDKETFTITCQDVAETVHVIKEEHMIAEMAATQGSRREHFASMYT